MSFVPCELHRVMEFLDSYMSFCLCFWYLQGIAKRLVRAALQEAAKKREMRYNDIMKIDKGIRRHFHDDITVIVIYLDHHEGSSNGKFKQTGVGYTTAPVDIFSLNADEAENRMFGAVA